MLRNACLLLLVLILIPSISHAKTETIFADHKYVMGDNDSKNDARRMCFLEVKRKVLEKAGTYIDSHTQAKNYQLTKDEINSYAAALLKVETVKEEWKFVGENMAIFMTVKAEVDSSYIEKQLAKIKEDVSVQKKIKEQQSQLEELERRFLDLQKQLEKADSSKTLILRKERDEVFQEIANPTHRIFGPKTGRSIGRARSESGQTFEVFEPRNEFNLTPQFKERGRFKNFLYEKHGLSRTTRPASDREIAVRIASESKAKEHLLRQHVFGERGRDAGNKEHDAIWNKALLKMRENIKIRIMREVSGQQEEYDYKKRLIDEELKAYDDYSNPKF